jgi:hypothetical protein
MMVPDSPAARLLRAKSYPFGPPARSYLFRGGAVEPLADVAARVRGLTPVLASGSNAAPEQLARKFAAHGAATIPVTRVDLHNFDSVYNAHIAAYGSVPATLFPSPGTVLSTFVTWLDDAALAVMHATEQPGINYHYGELAGIAAEVEGLGRLDRAFAYISVAGCLISAGGPLALAEVPATARRFPAATQTQALARARDMTAPGLDLDAFILESVADADVRLARDRALAATARAFAHPGLRVIAV